MCQIFATMYNQRRKLDFTAVKNAGRKDPNVQLLMEIESALIEAECLKFPVVFIQKEVHKDLVPKIKEIIERHQAEITEIEEEATHIIYPVVEPLSDDFARPLFKRGDKYVMLHWYYFPESHDSWVPNSFELPDAVPESPPSPSNVWRVSASWVLDLEKYNEWMSEEDYEVDEQGRKQIHRLRLTVDDLDKVKVKPAAKIPKRKRSPSPPTKAGGKRKR